MTVTDFNAFCAALPHTSHVVQWGGAQVWKVAGKVFAIAGWNDADQELFVTFKVSEESFEMLKELPGLRPAPYLASRGLKWIQRTGHETMDDAALRDYLARSHRIVALGLPKRVRRELGLDAG
jgi:predicted DNA-binding protein (MmcQ/YjbR family)